MDLEMVFNELSLNPLASDVYVARQRMSRLIQTTALATGRFGVKRVLRLEPELLDMPLAPSYSLNLWRNDKQVDREEKRYFRNLQTKYPALVDFEDTEIEDQYLLAEFRYQGLSAHGLGVAYLLKALALSLNSEEKWNKSQLPLQIPETVIIYHASHPKHIQDNTNWIKQRLEEDDPWLKHGLPRAGKYPYIPPKAYWLRKLDDFPTKLHGNHKVFIDHKEQLWLWDKVENHWDVQFKPYGLGNYFRVTPDGRLLDDGGQ